jgi:hypothetical protein
MDEFLPTNYEVPVSDGNYMKLKIGENRFRVLSSAIVGYEYWTKDNKPVRSRTLWEEVPTDARLDKDRDGNPTLFKPKHFWAFVVFNFEAKKVQVLEITQKSIMGAMQAYVQNPKWGDPKGYDFAITASGEGLDREYATITEPLSESPVQTPPHLDLSVLYEGGDPFAPAA